jgi:4-amino-4-deoxy-L-arabinose transferase-like glycosyltransferase
MVREKPADILAARVAQPLRAPPDSSAMSWLNALRARPLVGLLLLGTWVLTAGLGRELWTPDEPRVAAIGLAMWESGDLAVPRLSGQPFLEKPPLYWWLESASFAAFGEATPTAARFPSAVLGLATLLLTWALARRFLPRDGALLAAVAVLSFGSFFLTSHWVLVDNALVTAVVGSYAAFAYADVAQGGRRSALLVGGWLALAAAFLVKGVVGVGIPVLGIGVAILWTRRWREFIGLHLVWGPLLVIVPAALWLWRLDANAGREALETFVLSNQVARFIPGAFEYTGGHTRPFWYYAEQLPAIWLPWTPCLVLAAIWARQCWAELAPNVRDGLRWSAAGTLPVIAVLSVAGTKRGLYMDPVIPLAALSVGAFGTLGVLRAGWASRLDRELPRWIGAIALLTLVAVLFVPHGWPHSLWRSLPLLAFAIAWWRSPPLERDDRWLGAALAIALGLAQAVTAVGPRIDEDKKFTPFVVALAREVPPEEPVIAVEPDETILGVLEFYTDREVSTAPLDALAGFAASPEPRYLVVRDRRPTGGRWQAIRDSGVPIEWLSESRIGPKRTLRIAVVGGGRGQAEPPRGQAEGGSG